MFLLIWLSMTLGAGVSLLGTGLVGDAGPVLLSEVPPAIAASEPRAAEPGYTAEPQQPTGRFTTATEVRPILQATRANWIAIREYEGQDLLYVTHLMAWRCGLAGLRIGVNGEAPQDWPLPPCHEDSPAPNALTESDGLPYRVRGLGSIRTVSVHLIYDDLGDDRAEFDRAAVLMP